MASSTSERVQRNIVNFGSVDSQSIHVLGSSNPIPNLSTLRGTSRTSRLLTQGFLAASPLVVVSEQVERRVHLDRKPLSRTHERGSSVQLDAFDPTARRGSLRSRIVPSNRRVPSSSSTASANAARLSAARRSRSSSTLSSVRSDAIRRRARRPPASCVAIREPVGTARTSLPTSDRPGQRDPRSSTRHPAQEPVLEIGVDPAVHNVEAAGLPASSLKAKDESPQAGVL